MRDFYDHILCFHCQKFYRFFEDAKYAELKLKFYGYMIELGQHEGDYLDICKNFRQVLDTSLIQEDAVKRIQTMKNVVLYVVLAKYDNEQSDLIHRFKQCYNAQKAFLKRVCL